MTRLQRLFAKALPPSRWITEIRAEKSRYGFGGELLLSLFAVLICLLLEGFLLLPYTMILFTAKLSPLAAELAAGVIDQATYDALASAEIAEALSSTGFALFSLFSTSLAALGAIFYWRVMRRRPYFALGLDEAENGTEYLLGFLLGALMLGSVVLCGLGTRAVVFDTVPAATVSPALLFAFFVAFVIQGFSEELLCRGIVMTAIAKFRSLPVAVAASALVFALLHAGGTAVHPITFLNLFLFGILCAVYALRRGSLWGAAALHAAWSFFEGKVFGFSFSGAARGDSIFHLLPTANRTLLSGGDRGLEGGLLVTFILVIFTVLICIFPSRRELSRGTDAE